MLLPERSRALAIGLSLTCSLLFLTGYLVANSGAQRPEVPQDPLPQELAGSSYTPVVIDRPLAEIRLQDEAERPAVQARQRALLEERYHLDDHPSDVAMSGGRRQVQRGLRARLPEGVTWDQLGRMSPREIRERGLWPAGFRALPHVKHASGGMVFPQDQIDEIQRAERRDLERWDVEFDLPEHLLPEFPPPMFLTNRPDLGDVSQGQVVTLKNFHELTRGLLTPFQLEGLRMLVTPFPQQQFNATEDRKVADPSLGVTCFDCHVNGHTNAAFHLNPDTRPQALRFRIDTPSLRGMFNQQLHGSKRALRSVEDFTEFEQRTAYFDGDHVTAAKKGVNALERGTFVAAMGQLQSMLDFPPAPKLDVFGRLDPALSTDQELRGEQVFFGRGRCGECHPAPHYLDDKMHDLRVDRFYEARVVNDHFDRAVGPIKTTTLRGIKDSPPYLHDGRLLTLDDSVQFFDLVLQTGLTPEEKADLVAFLLCL
jgi:cytochrome c peroxidase